MVNWKEKTIVFDLDGTLIDTAPDLHAALSYAYSRKGMDVIGLDELRDTIGNGARAMILKSASILEIDLSEDLLDQLHVDFLKYYTHHIADYSRPFPGMTDTLDFLEDNGAILAVCTNKTQALAEQSLTEIGLRKRFAAVLGGDRASEAKPSPKHIEETVTMAGGHLDQSVMIGDSSSDGLSAKAAGIPFILMTYGYPDDKVSGLTPAASLSSAKDLPAAIQWCFS